MLTRSIFVSCMFLNDAQLCPLPLMYDLQLWPVVSCEDRCGGGRRRVPVPRHKAKSLRNKLPVSWLLEVLTLQRSEIFADELDWVKITQFKSIWYLNNVNYYICWNFRMSSHVTVKRLPAPPDNSSGKFWEFFDKQSLDSFPHKDFGKPRFSFKKRAGAWFQ